MPKKIQPGDRYNKLTVLYQLPEKRNNRNVYHCKCDCGNEIDILSSTLSQQQSCGCAKRKIRQNPNALKGQTFGTLTVIELSPEHRASNGSAKWKCQCECGNIVYLTSTALKTGHNKTCGDLKHKQQTYLGYRFGKLTVIEYDYLIKQNDKYLVKCQCDCGNIIHAQISNLKSGTVHSCGCDKIISKGEEKIKQLLQDNNIMFETEKTFPDLINPKTNYKLRFDFYLPEYNILIEYDGKQHFEQTAYWGGVKGLEEQKYRDNLKDEWSKKHNIPLIRITPQQLNLV